MTPFQKHVNECKECRKRNALDICSEGLRLAEEASPGSPLMFLLFNALLGEQKCGHEGKPCYCCVPLRELDEGGHDVVRRIRERRTETEDEHGHERLNDVLRQFETGDEKVLEKQDEPFLRRFAAVIAGGKKS